MSCCQMNQVGLEVCHVPDVTRFCLVTLYSCCTLRRRCGLDCFLQGNDVTLWGVLSSIGRCRLRERERKCTLKFKFLYFADQADAQA